MAKSTPLLEQLLAELTTKKAGKAKAGKYIIEVNGRIITKRITKAELIKQVRSLACTTADVNVFKLEGSATSAIPVTIGEPVEEAKGGTE